MRNTTFIKAAAKKEKTQNFCISRLTDETRLNYIKSAFAKSSASRGKLNLSMANSSTPVLTRAFFVRSIYAPIKNNLSFDRLFSMVARNGQPLAVGCFPLIAVFHPVTCYRPTVESLAVVLENLSMDTAEMIYKFLCVNRT
ncbi:TPA: ash family protein, partial [Haemophilus influenzae]